MLRRVLIFAAVMTVAMAAVAILQLEDKPEEYKNCDGCWLSEFQQFIPINESFPSPTECVQYNCRATLVQLVSCGVVATMSPDDVTIDSSQPYPYCCPQPV